MQHEVDKRGAALPSNRVAPLSQAREENTHSPHSCAQLRHRWRGSSRYASRATTHRQEECSAPLRGDFMNQKYQKLTKSQARWHTALIQHSES